MRKAVILVSGGADSTTVLAMIAGSYQVHALSFNYQQRHHIELIKIQQIIQHYNVKQHRIINIDLASFGQSALTDVQIKVPKYSQAQEVGSNIPVTYVPARNTIFLSYALGLAEIIGANDIFLGVHATDYANYPDCRLEYIKSFEVMANLATASGARGEKMTIHAPVIDLTKSAIIKIGLSLGVDYSQTISCYDPSVNGDSCRRCLACLVRLQAFADNNLVDPVSYVSINSGDDDR